MYCSKILWQNILSVCLKTLILHRYKEFMIIQHTWKHPRPPRNHKIFVLQFQAFKDITDFTDVSCMSRSRQINEHILIIFALRTLVRNMKWYEVNFIFHVLQIVLHKLPQLIPLLSDWDCKFIAFFDTFFCTTLYQASYGFHPLPPLATLSTFFLQYTCTY